MVWMEQRTTRAAPKSPAEYVSELQMMTQNQRSEDPWCAPVVLKYIVWSAAKVEIDVPQTCSFVLRTTECSLSEISEVDEEGNTIYRPAAGAKAFKDAMAR